MKKAILWKLGITVVVLAWAVLSLLPFRDTAFPDYLRSKASADTTTFRALVSEAESRVADGNSPSVYVALRTLARERRIDLVRHFPDLKLEASLRNLERRNQIVLDELLRRSKASLKLGLDLQGGVSFVLEVGDSPEGDAAADASAERRREALGKAIEIIGNRVNAFGVAEPVIRPVGDNRIEVQLAGLNTKDNPDVLDALKKPARLDFRIVHPTQPSGLPGETPPLGYEVMELENEGPNGEILAEPLFVKRVPEMFGGVENAFAHMNEVNGGYEVIIDFTSQGSRQFGDLTTANVGRQLAIVLDGKLYSAPRINEPITGGRCQITGRFTQREVIELANVLNNPLEVELSVAELNEVGPTLAQDAIDSGIRASVIGAALVIAFTVTFYHLGGVAAVISLAANALLLLGVMASIGATLTLPGLAGVVLSIGMAVDANILVFERIREELRAGKTIASALEGGFDRAFSAILDANITTLITSLLMIAYGTGPVKGFGVTLTIGIFSTMFGALIVTRLLLQTLVHSGAVRTLTMLPVFGRTDFDFMRFARPAFIVTWVIVLAGITTAFIKGSDVFGIDFLGGDEVVLTYSQTTPPPSTGAVRDAVAAALGTTDVSPFFQSAIGGGNPVLKVQAPSGLGAKVGPAIIAAFPASAFEVAGVNQIGAAVSSEILANAIISLVLAIVGILIYVAFRFEVGFGLGAVVSTLHDVLMTIGIYVMFDRQFTAPMVAAILLIVGYSINDTIVVFDRIREELKLNPGLRLRQVINLSLNLTLSRTLLTSVTTFLAAGSLLIFGTGAINDVAFTFIVGIITGTFSSVFVASPVFFWWHKGERLKLDGQAQAEAPRYDWVVTTKAAQ